MYLHRNKKNELVFEDDFYTFISELEESFEINLKLDEKSRGFANIGQLLSYILSHLSFSSEASTVEQKALGKVKETIEKTFGKPFDLNANLDDLLAPNVKKSWIKLEKDLNLKLPPLFSGTNINLLFILLWGIGSLFCITYVPKMQISEHWQVVFSDKSEHWMGLLSLPVWWLFCFWLERKLTYNLPVKTVNQLVESIIDKNYERLTEGKYSKPEIEEFLRRKIARYAGVDEKMITDKLLIRLIASSS